MKATPKKRDFTFCLCGAVICAAAWGIRAQEAAHNGIIAPPPNSRLLPVTLPDVTKLEPDVRQHLLSSQRVLATVVANPRTPPAQLAEAYGSLGQLFHAYSMIVTARECYLNANQLAPKDFRWIYLLGKLDQDEDRVNEAIRRYTVVRTLRPDYLAAIINLGNIYLQLNRLAEAKLNFMDALALEPNNAPANYGLGQVALSQRNYAEAASRFEMALAELPGANRIHYSLAMAYRGLGNTGKARTHLDQQGPVGVRVADPLVDNLQELIAGERLHLVRGKRALEAKRYAEAVTEFGKALDAKPDSLEAHLNMGAALTQTGDMRGAIAQFQEALRIDSRNVNAHYNLAVLLANENQFELAISHLQAVLAIDANDLGARYLLAEQLLKANRLEEALSEFSRVVDADPDNEAAVLGHAKLLLGARDYRLARERLEKAHARHPDRMQTATMLASLLAASPQYDLRDGTRALELAKGLYESTGSTYHGAIVAMALAELGRCDEAAAFVRMLIEKATKDVQPELLDRLRQDLSRYEKERPCRPRA